jgi:hypothetical protein
LGGCLRTKKTEKNIRKGKFDKSKKGYQLLCPWRRREKVEN